MTKLLFSLPTRANLDFDVLLEIFSASLAKIFKFKKEKLLQQLLKNGRKCCIKSSFENDTRLAILDVHLHMNCTSLGLFEASDLGHSTESSSTNTTRSKSSNCERMQQPASSYVWLETHLMGWSPEPENASMPEDTHFVMNN